MGKQISKSFTEQKPQHNVFIFNIQNSFKGGKYHIHNSIIWEHELKVSLLVLLSVFTEDLTSPIENNKLHMQYFPYLIEIRIRFRLSYAIEVFYIYKLEVVQKASIGCSELWQKLHVRQVTQVLVAPVVEVTQTVQNTQTQTTKSELQQAPELLQNSSDAYGIGASVGFQWKE